jgi:hypothetical protein
MGFFDRLFGADDTNAEQAPPPQRGRRSDDEIAVERYRYLLRTAPPEAIEQVHAEAFSKLTQEQRDLLFTQLSENASEAPRDASPAALASSATRQELRNPGTMERSFGGGGMGFGGTLASSLLGTVAGYVIGSAIVSAFMPDPGADAGSDSGAESSDTADAGGDGGGGDTGGDFGGGDFGGGDFGGGDLGGGFDF